LFRSLRAYVVASKLQHHCVGRQWPGEADGAAIGQNIAQPLNDRGMAATVRNLLARA
jgi:hypothetical protein